MYFDENGQKWEDGHHGNFLQPKIKPKRKCRESDGPHYNEEIDWSDEYLLFQSLDLLKESDGLLSFVHERKDLLEEE